jgi:hypothetical protein
MQLASRESLEEQVISILRGISGARTIDLDQMISRDVGIYGLDGVMAVEALEEQFGIDLDPLINAHTNFLPPRWFDRLRGRTHGPPNADLTVRELVDYIASETRREAE